MSKANNNSLVVSSNTNQLFPKCIQKAVNPQIFYPIKETDKKPTIDYKHLEWIANLEEACNSKEEAHELFMKNYKKIFSTNDNNIKALPSIATTKKAETALATLPAAAADKRKKDELLRYEDDEDEKENSDKAATAATNEDEIHDIKYHIEKIHGKKSDIEDENFKRLAIFKRLKKLVKKYPFERSDQENHEIYKIMSKHVPDFRHQFQPSQQQMHLDELLERLCTYAQIEHVAERGQPVFGHLAFHVVLKGSLKALTEPHVFSPLDPPLPRVTPEPPETPQILDVGSCFGTLHELKRELTTLMFRCVTREDNCMLLKISVENAQKVHKSLLEESHAKKLATIRQCSAYESWPRHALEELLEQFEWRLFPANTSFISEGTCHVLRKVDVPYYDPKKKNAKPEKRMKQVVIGTLKERESFGEISVTMKEAMTCSIVTETDCKIGIIACEKIINLNDITLRLLLQTTTRNYSNMTQDDIYKKFIAQEKKREWKQVKSLVVSDVLDKYGIVNGRGKYITNNTADKSIYAYKPMLDDEN